MLEIANYRPTIPNFERYVFHFRVAKCVCPLSALKLI